MKVIALALVLGLVPLAGATATTSISGTLVNIASYVTGDANATTFNMGAMMGGNGGYAMMNGSGGNGGYGMMNGSGGNGGYAHMYGCRSALGLVTNAGQLYVLVVDAPAFNVTNLCSSVGSSATVQGTVFQKGGMNAIRVDSFSTHS